MTWKQEAHYQQAKREYERLHHFDVSPERNEELLVTEQVWKERMDLVEQS